MRHDRVLVPAFNEEANVATVVEQVTAAGYRILVIDDGSSDRTAVLASEAGATVVSLPVNVGIGGALRCGFRYAVDHDYDVAVQCDADGQHRPPEITNLLEALEVQGAHLVIGSRFAAIGAARPPKVRYLAMRVLTAVARRKSGVHLTDSTSGFRAVRRPLLDYFAASYPSEYLENVEALIVASRAGYRVVEVPVGMDARAVGPSTASPAAAGWYVVRVLAAVVLRPRRRPPARTAGRSRLGPRDPVVPDEPGGRHS